MYNLLILFSFAKLQSTHAVMHHETSMTAVIFNLNIPTCNLGIIQYIQIYEWVYVCLFMCTVFELS